MDCSCFFAFLILKFFYWYHQSWVSDQAVLVSYRRRLNLWPYCKVRAPTPLWLIQFSIHTQTIWRSTDMIWLIWLAETQGWRFEHMYFISTNIIKKWVEKCPSGTFLCLYHDQHSDLLCDDNRSECTTALGIFWYYIPEYCQLATLGYLLSLSHPPKATSPDAFQCRQFPLTQDWIPQIYSNITVTLLAVFCSLL